ncbi:hypothetical protein B0T25DRAFT_582555 [Lasiosphaeria hispida]|uniref:Ecp2 effector protein domain-containing protein n=1 Tax=Lasiosphaeria hispida TaxID=260671 RepID=A0AAJ0MCI4_9PEZI|nr:hypothetical protein B0T25DRAFT_582555 [Lasiosphaeria hispida]
MSRLNIMPGLVLATLFTLFFGALGATDTISTVPTAVSSPVSPSIVSTMVCDPANNATDPFSATESFWTCVPPRPNWCVLTLTTHLSEASGDVSALRADLYNASCAVIGSANSKGWGLLQVLSSTLPDALRFVAHPIRSDTGVDESEFWFGDGHWVGRWTQSMPAENVQVSSRDWDCSFTQGHRASRGARVGGHGWMAILGGLVGVPLVLGAAF